MAYEVRISCWSSDVCSSDLQRKAQHRQAQRPQQCIVDARSAQRDARPLMQAVPPDDAAVDDRNIDCADKRIDRRAARHRAALPLAPGTIGITARQRDKARRTEEPTSELRSLMRTSYAVFRLKNHHVRLKRM